MKMKKKKGENRGEIYINPHPIHIYHVYRVQPSFYQQHSFPSHIRSHLPPHTSYSNAAEHHQQQQHREERGKASASYIHQKKNTTTFCIKICGKRSKGRRSDGKSKQKHKPVKSMGAVGE